MGAIEFQLIQQNAMYFDLFLINSHMWEDIHEVIQDLVVYINYMIEIHQVLLYMHIIKVNTIYEIHP
jgi:hypothetical protein